MQDSSHTNYEGTQFLESMEESLPKYNSYIVNKFMKFYIGGEVLDFGAGTGTLSEIWYTKTMRKPTCVEIDTKQRLTLESKGFSSLASLDGLSQKVDFVFTSNVLEHIENDREALQRIFSILPEGGRLAIYVPALPMLFSELDRSVGHYRRYKRRELIEKVEQAGFIVHKCFYNDSVGVVASLLLKIFGFRQGKALGANLALRFYDSIVFPISAIFDLLFFKRVIGKNLFLFAEKAVI